MPEAIRVLEKIGERYNISFDFDQKDWSCERYHKFGSMMPEDGLDEISTASSTSVAELRDGKIKEYSISPNDFGFKTLAIEGLKVSSPEESLQIAKEALKGENQAAAQMVAMTSGAALYVAGLADTIKIGVDISMEGLKKGIGLQKLDELVSFSQSLKHRG